MRLAPPHTCTDRHPPQAAPCTHCGALMHRSALARNTFAPHHAPMCNGVLRGELPPPPLSHSPSLPLSLPPCSAANVWCKSPGQGGRRRIPHLHLVPDSGRKSGEAAWCTRSSASLNVMMYVEVFTQSSVDGAGTRNNSDSVLFVSPPI